MSNILSFLKSLLSTAGLSGGEASVADLIAARWRPLVDEVSVGRLGSLHGLKKGTGRSSRPAMMLAAHMDGIGMRVSNIVDGFLHVAKIGSIDLHVLSGAEVIVHATGSHRQLPAVVVMPPRRFLPESAGDGIPGIEHFLVDTGLLPREVEKQVRIGDLISFANEPLELAGGVLSGHTVDNRASIAALTLCLEELQSKPHVWDVWAVATVQEEINYLGAQSSAFELRPQIAIAMDTTFAKGPGADSWQTFPMGKGVGLCIGPNMHPFLHKKLRELAEQLAIPWFLDITPADSGTDASAIQISAEGIPTALVEVAIRYMHTPVESVAVQDIEHVGHLLAEFIALLEADFVDTIVWE
ncbi:MAG TPA: hypothetical protein VHP14_22045 [Anaerolineales bacterium]|nr:hypothetical protein [Anaerolineales bacterium]